MDLSNSKFKRSCPAIFRLHSHGGARRLQMTVLQVTIIVKIYYSASETVGFQFFVFLCFQKIFDYGKTLVVLYGGRSEIFFGWSFDYLVAGRSWCFVIQEDSNNRVKNYFLDSFCICKKGEKTAKTIASSVSKFARNTRRFFQLWAIYSDYLMSS